jgi:surface protein
MVFAHNWRIYDNTPAGATIQSVEDEGKNNAVLFNGAGVKNGYILGGREWENQKWNDTAHKSIQWSMKFDNSYVVYVRVMTTKGARYIYYTKSNTSRGIIKTTSSTYIHLGLGSDSADDTWHTITRDLNADLRTAEPDNTVTVINAILVRGDGMVGDVERVGNEPEPGTALTREELLQLIANWAEAKSNYGRVDQSKVKALEDKIINANTSEISDMSHLFASSHYHYDERARFNLDISHWDTSKVTDMSYMFSKAYSFNQDISGWDVSHVTNMEHMFEGEDSDTGHIAMIYVPIKSAFNQDISGWDVSNVINMSGMFCLSNFNQDISKWDVSNVINHMDFVGSTRGKGNYYEPALIAEYNPFYEPIPTDTPLTREQLIELIKNWGKNPSQANADRIIHADTSEITDMNHLFNGHHYGYLHNQFLFYPDSVRSSLRNFNLDISGWDVSNVADMDLMFTYAKSFNQDISGWDVSNVTDHDHFATDSALTDAHNPFADHGGGEPGTELITDPLSLDNWQGSFHILREYNQNTYILAGDEAYAYIYRAVPTEAGAVYTVKATLIGADESRNGHFAGGSTLSIINDLPTLYDSDQLAISQTVTGSTPTEVSFTFTATGSTSYVVLRGDTAWQYPNLQTLSVKKAGGDTYIDTTPPVITLNGSPTVTLTVGDTYIDAGATATDDKDGDIITIIVTGLPIDTSTAGTYTITYTAKDAARNQAVKTRTVVVKESGNTGTELITDPLSLDNWQGSFHMLREYNQNTYILAGDEAYAYIYRAIPTEAGAVYTVKATLIGADESRNGHFTGGSIVAIADSLPTSYQANEIATSQSVSGSTPTAVSFTFTATGSTSYVVLRGDTAWQYPNLQTLSVKKVGE